ncbi:unnamed protein product, partial [Coregonus sp. 'balchen']
SRVSISCPNMSGEDLRFHLSVNQCLVHTTLLQRNQSHTRTNQPDTWAQFFLVDQNLNQNLTNRYVFTVNSTGVYTCRAERMWSPPYQEDSRKLKKEVSERSDYVNIKPGEKTGPKRIHHP